MTDAPRPRWTPIVAVVLLWLAGAIALGASGRLDSLRPPAPQIVVLVLTAVVLAACAFVPAVRAWVFGVDLRILVALHLVRFVGAYFIVLFRQGQLPFLFAVPGGWGDILAASFAAALLAAGAPTTPTRRVAYAVWNGLAFLDLLFVVTTAARLGIADPGSMRALLRLPLSLLPTFLVPLLIASHVVIAIRLARGTGGGRGD
jgi:hypothetical protein